jgi:anti-sigma B factor antagonist
MSQLTVPFAVTQELQDGVRVLRVSGELDLYTAPDLCHALALARSAARRIVVDLGEVTFCDSTALRALMGAAREVEIASGWIAFVVPPGSPTARLFNVSGAREFLIVADSAAEALA